MVTARSNMVNTHFGRHFITYLQYALMYFNETQHSYSIPGPRNTDDIFKSWVQRSRSQKTFLKIYFSSRHIPINSMPLKTIWFL